MAHSFHDNHIPDPSIGHDTRDVNIKLILFSTVVMVVIVLITCFFTVGIFDFLNAHSGSVPQSTSLTAPKEIPPVPRVLEHPWEELPVLRGTETRTLNSYAWVNQGGGTVRIPVDRAIDLLAARGLPVEPSAGAAAPVKKAAAATVAAKPAAKEPSATK